MDGTENGALRLCIFDPTGNITALVESAVEPEAQPSAAARIMARFPAVEQVGFVCLPEREDEPVALRMAGGEFCGNATMCAAAWYAERARLSEGTIVVATSGASKPVEVRVERLVGRTYAAAVHMPGAIAAQGWLPDR